jgi:cytochrome c-type biogenesis protein
MGKAGLVLGALALLFISCAMQGAMAFPEFTRVYYTPDNITKDDDVAVIAEVTNSSDVKQAYLTYCKVVPELCFIPKEMQYVGGGAYSVGIGKFDENQEMKFNVTLYFKDGNSTVSDTIHFTVQPIGGGNNTNNTNNTNTTVPPVNVTTPATPPDNTNLYITIALVLGTVLVAAPAYYLKRKTWIAIIAVLLVVCFLASYMYLAFTTVTVKKPAPDLELTDVFGVPLKLSSMKGGVVLLELTAINCIGCNILMKSLLEVSHKYGSRITMVSVFVSPVESDSDIQKYREDHNATWRFARDTDDALAKYNAVLIPKLLVIDKNGGILWEITGEPSTAEISKHIDEGLAGKLSSGSTAGAEFIASLGLGGMAILAGFASYFSPCSFPMLPGYMTHYLKASGVGTSYRKAAAGGGAAALGIVLVYGSIGLLITLLGEVIKPYVAYLQPIIGVILLILGILMLTPMSFMMGGGFLTKIQGMQQGKGFYYSLFLYGMGYAAASLGCTLPIFIGVVLAPLQSGSIYIGLGVLALFCMSVALLMVAVTLLVAGFKNKLLNRLKASTEIIKKVSAISLIIVGIVLVALYVYSVWK